MIEKLTKLWNDLDVSVLASEDARRRRLLNIILLAIALSAILLLIPLLIALYLDAAGERNEVQFLCLGLAMAFLGAGIIYLLNRYVSGTLAGMLLILLLIVIAVFSDEPQRVVDGRGLLVFAIPILAASVILRPWASFVAAAACTLAIAVVGWMAVQQMLPNLPAVLIFFILALLSWLSANSLEQAIEKLNAGNRQLRESEERYRQLVELEIAARRC